MNVISIKDIKKAIYIKNRDNISLSTDLSMKTIRIINYMGNFTKYHNFNKQFVTNILISNGSKVIVENMHYAIDKNIKKYIEKIYPEDIYVFNSIDYAFFLICLKFEYISEQDLFRFLKSIRYIFINYEVIKHDKLSQIGFDIICHYKSILYFYNNALALILQSDKNISYLYENTDIYNKNIFYFPSEGYSKINNYVPLECNEKDIDILIYGNMHPILIYRNNIVDKIRSYCDNKKYKYLIRDDLADDEKNEVLKRTKIVLHIPSHNNLHTIPWAKISELMCKKIFFISEKSEEIKNNINFIASYTSIEDLYQKIELYLSRDELRKEIVEKCFNFIYEKYNSDVFYPSLILK